MLTNSWLTLVKNSFQKLNSRRAGTSRRKRPRSLVSSQPSAELLETRALLSATGFVEDFSAGTLPGNLERSGNGLTAAAVNGSYGGSVFENGYVRFTGEDTRGDASGGLRTFLRTVDDDYSSVDFVAEVTVTIVPNSGSPYLGRNIAFFGLGTAESGAFGEPDSAGIRLNVAPTNFNFGLSVVDGGNNGGDFGAGGDGTYRLRMEWSACEQTATFQIDKDYTGGAFVADYTRGPFDGSDNGFNATNARLFIGGDWNTRFDDFSVVVADPACGSSTLSIGNATVTEGNSGTTVLSYPVTLSHTVDVAVSVDYSTSNGTATAGSDYVTQTGTLTIPAGSTTGTIDITVKGDTAIELNEMLSVVLSNLQASGRDVTFEGADPPSAGLVAVNAAGTDAGGFNAYAGQYGVLVPYISTPVVTTISDFAVGDTINFHLQGQGWSAATWTLKNGDGVVVRSWTYVPPGAGQDFEEDVSYTVTGLGNDTTLTQALNGPGGGITSFYPADTSPFGVTATHAASVAASGTITNDDIATVSIGNASVTEGNSGTTVLSFPVTLSKSVDVAVSVDYATQDGTATAGSDYVGVTNGTLTIPAGSTTGTINITVNGDTTIELNEKLSVALSNVQASGRDVTLGGNATAPGIVQLDASTLTLVTSPVVSSWGGQTAGGTPTLLAGQTPNGGAAVQFNGGGDRLGDNVFVPASAAGDFIYVAVAKANNIGAYHNLVDDDASNRPMLWIDTSFRYEMNFSGGGGARNVGTGPGGWDIVIMDSRLNQLYVNSATPNATGGGAVPFTAGETFDFFHRDGGQTFQGLVAEARIYNDRAAFGGNFAALYNELQTKWFGAGLSSSVGVGTIVNDDFNTPPTASAGGPYTVAEGSSIVLNGSGSSDAEQSAASLTYQWDLDGDGIFGETGAGAVRGNEVGIAPTFSATVLNESVRTVALKVTDNAGAVSGTATAQITIANVAPTVTVRNVTVTVNEGQIATNGGSFGDTGQDSPVISASVGDVSQTGGGSIAYVGSIGGLGTPIEMAFDSAGNLFVAEDSPGAVSKFNSSGTLVTRWTIGGAATGLAVDSAGNVYVTSKALHNIQVYTNSGVFIRTIGGFGSGNGQFNQPHAITLDAAGNIYVTENGNSRVQVLDNAGNFLRKWGTLGSGNGQFNFPQGIELDSAGNVYVTDRGNNRLQKFDSNGNFLTKWSVAGQTAGVGIDSADHIFVSNFSNPSIQVFTSTGVLITTFGSTGSGPGQFNLPHGVEFDAQGSIWVADWVNGRVQEFSIPNLWSWSFATSDGSAQSQTVTISADDGDATNNIGSTTFTLIVNNVAPTAALSNGGAVDEGSVGSASFSGQFDPSTVDTSAGFHYAFDFDNDGTFDSGDGTYGGSGTNASVAVPASFLADGPGTRIIKGRILDKDGGYTDYTTNININNVAPTLSGLSASAILENGTTTLSGTIADVGTLDTFKVEIDWDNDGVYDESHTGIAAGAFSYTHQYLDDDPTGTSVDNMPINVKVTDDDSGSVTGNTTVEVTNVVPVLTSVVSTAPEPCDSSVDGHVTISGSFADVGTLDTHTVLVNWGDGSPVEAVSVDQDANTFSGTHLYATGGVFRVTVTAVDDDGGVSTGVLSTAVVQGVGVIDGTLYIIGTDGRDHVDLKFNEKKNELKVDVKLNQTGGSEGGSDGGSDGSKQTFAISAINRIVAYLCDGDDHYNGGADGGSDGGSDGGAGAAISQFVFGGGGNDQIQGGRGNNVLSGGAGNDDIQGGGGRDILIGGTGKDKLKGGDGNDLLVGGAAANENDLASLDAALAHWSTGGLAAALDDIGTITDDGDRDDLKGEKGIDELIGGVGDKLKQ